jgi:DnaK suppressor protein
MAAKKRSTRKPSRRLSAKKPTAKSRKAKPAAASRRVASAAGPARKAVTAKSAKAPVAKALSKPEPARTQLSRSPSRPKPTPLPRALPVRPLPSRRSELQPIKSSVGLIHGIPPYQPKGGETYMNERQLDHFRQILLAWKRELMEEVDRTVHHMQDEASNFPDPNDRATQESEFGLELRTRDRERKLLKKIDSAIARIDEGTYGYCEETGEEIGLRRLEARPVATLSVEAQERRELAERQFRDREDGN